MWCLYSFTNNCTTVCLVPHLQTWSAQCSVFLFPNILCSKAILQQNLEDSKDTYHNRSIDWITSSNHKWGSANGNALCTFILDSVLSISLIHKLYSYALCHHTVCSWKYSLMSLLSPDVTLKLLLTSSRLQRRIVPVFVLCYWSADCPGATVHTCTLLPTAPRCVRSSRSGQTSLYSVASQASIIPSPIFWPCRKCIVLPSLSTSSNTCTLPWLCGCLILVQQRGGGGNPPCV